MKQALLIFVLISTSSVYGVQNSEEQELPKALEQPEPRTLTRQVNPLLDQNFTEGARVLFRKFTPRNNDRLIPNPSYPRNCASGHLRVFTGLESWQNQRY